MNEKNTDIIKLYLNRTELDVVNTLRAGGFDELIIKMSQGKINRIDKKIFSKEKDVHKILRNCSYSELKIIVDNGNVVNIQETIKKKV